MSLELKVKEFMEATGQTTRKLNTQQMLLYFMLIKEELKELDESETAVEALDAIVDICWVVMGLGYSLGFDMVGAIEEVYKSNMSKLGEDGKPILREDGKILKGPNYFKPDLRRFTNGL